MIKINNISKSFKSNTVIENLSLTVNSSQITALIGKNGSGKTTLMRLISGLLKPDSGNINCNTKNIGDNIAILSNKQVIAHCSIKDFFADYNNEEKINKLKNILEG